MLGTLNNEDGGGIKNEKCIKQREDIWPQTLKLLSYSNTVCQTLKQNSWISHDVTAAMLVSPNNEMAAMLVSRSNPSGFESYYYANVFFCFR